eukprot:SAG22_NODE_1014_length_6027_cov_3.998988_5_plen_147_part_00
MKLGAVHFPAVAARLKEIGRAIVRPPPPPAPAPNECFTERLHNGICLPSPWPPARNYTREYTAPAYLTTAAHPGVVSIDVGRQLFVDNFLIQSLVNANTTYHCATPYEGNPILRTTKSWEQGVTMPFSGASCLALPCLAISLASMR